MLTFKNRKALIINIRLTTNQVDNACFLATRAAQTMSVLRATICCKHYRLIKLIPQHPAKQAKAMSGKQVPDRMLAHAARAKGTCDDFSVCRAFCSFGAPKGHDITTTKRIYDCRLRVSCIKENKRLFNVLSVLKRYSPYSLQVNPFFLLLILLVCLGRWYCKDLWLSTAIATFQRESFRQLGLFFLLLIPLVCLAWLHVYYQNLEFRSIQVLP